MQGFRPERVLVIMAHPDDPEFTSGGTIARFQQDGAWIGYVICTTGDKGSEDRAISTYELARTREAEQRTAAARLGVASVEFLRHEDGALQHTVELRRSIVAAMRRHTPDTVICFDPTTRYFDAYVQHSDHYSSGEAVLAALYPAARNARTFPELLLEGLEPHVVRQAYLCSPAQPNCWGDITATIDLKVEAMLDHTSQVSDRAGLAAFLRHSAAEAGKQAQPAPLQYAEPFRYIDTAGG